MPLLYLMMTFINAHAWWVTYTRRWWQNHWPWVTTRSICKSHLLPMNVHLEHPKATHQHCQVLHILTWCFSSLLYFWLFLDMSCCCHASNRLSMLFSEFALKWSSPTTMWGTFPINHYGCSWCQNCYTSIQKISNMKVLKTRKVAEFNVYGQLNTPYVHS